MFKDDVVAGFEYVLWQTLDVEDVQEDVVVEDEELKQYYDWAVSGR